MFSLTVKNCSPKSHLQESDIIRMLDSTLKHQKKLSNLITLIKNVHSHLMSQSEERS